MKDCKDCIGKKIKSGDVIVYSPMTATGVLRFALVESVEDHEMHMDGHSADIFVLNVKILCVRKTMKKKSFARVYELNTDFYSGRSMIVIDCVSWEDVKKKYVEELKEEGWEVEE